MSEPQSFKRNCHLCEAMCGVTVKVDGARVLSVRPNEYDVWSRGHICPKGTTLGALHHDPDRLRRPMIRDGSEFRAASWDAAFERLELLAGGVRERHGPHAFAAYAGNMSGKDATLSRYARLLLQAAGIQQVYSASTLDQHPKNLSAFLMFGDEWRVPVPDLDHTHLFLILGGNPAASKGSIFSHRDVMGGIRELRGRGGRVVVVDPVRTGTAKAADQWIPIRPGADAAMLLAVAHRLFETDRVRLRRLAGKVAGLADLRTAVSDFAPEAVARFCGVTPETIRELADQLAASDRAAIYGRIGLCTQRFGTLASWMVDVLAVLTGNLDREGGSMWSRPVAAFTEMLAKLPEGFPLISGHSRVRGAPAVLGQFPAACLAEEIDSPGEGQIKGLVTLAGNPALSVPNSARLSAALPHLECMVSFDNYLNETTRHAHVILPSPSILESPYFDIWSWAFCLTSGGHYAPAIFDPGERPEHWRVVARAAAIIGGAPDADVEALDEQYFSALAEWRGVDAAAALAASPSPGPERILDLAIRSGPFGDRYGREPGGLTLDDFRAEENGRLIGKATPRAHEGFNTPSGKIELAPAHILNDLPRLRRAIAQDEERPLTLVSRRHLRSLNSWMHNVETLVKGRDRCTLQIHPDDAAPLGVGTGDRVAVSTATGTVELSAEVTSDLRPGVVSMPHGWGHDQPGARQSVASKHPGANFNILTHGDVVDEASGNAVFNGIEVQVRKLA